MSSLQKAIVIKLLLDPKFGCPWVSMTHLGNHI
jgi:hypothetical protein